MLLVFKRCSHLICSMLNVLSAVMMNSEVLSSRRTIGAIGFIGSSGLD